MDNILMLTEDLTPVKLKRISNPPAKLFACGNIELLKQKPSIAVVGSRKVMPSSIEATNEIVGGLVNAGFMIISGLAMGVDALAHKRALEKGGDTIAVLPTPIEVIYPRENFRLGQAIAEKGLLLSEYEKGMPPQKFFFAERNRIVSGLSDGVLIIQAAERSGTLITARLAKEQGKRLYAVPGDITKSSFAGNNRLIQEGAKLVTCANDIIEDFGLELATITKPVVKNPILKLIQEGIEDPFELQNSLGLSTVEFNQQITMLEIEGEVQKTTSGWRIYNK